MRIISTLLSVAIATTGYAQGSILEASNGVVKFHSDAPHELIYASSNQLRCAIDAEKRTFAFKISIVSFMGFNNALQKDHFNENYMESEKYPEAVYTGKIIEETDLSKDGEYDVRTKGKLRIHGIEQERIINAHVSVKSNRATVTSDFMVSLADHNIKIPRVVYDKLAPDVNVSVKATLKPKTK